MEFAKWLVTYEKYLEYTYARLKNTNFVIKNVRDLISLIFLL